MLSHGRLFTSPPLQLFPLQVRVFFIVSQYMIPLSSIGQKRETSVNLLWKLAVCFCFFFSTYSYCFFVLFYLGLVGRQLSVCFLLYFTFFLVFPHHPTVHIWGFFYSVLFLLLLDRGDWYCGDYGIVMGMGDDKTRPL